MSLYKRIYSLIISLAVLSVTIYYLGCASAESTTGKLAFQQKDFQKAEVELKKGLVIDKNDDEGWYMLGYSQIELGKFDDARVSFQKSLAISNNFAPYVNTYWIEKYNQGAKEFKNGIDAEARKDLDGAKRYYTDALKYFTASSAIIPDSLKSFSAMGESYLAMGDQNKALEIFGELAKKTNSVEASEKVAKIIFESGLSMMTIKNYPAALETFSKVLNISNLPKNDPYYETSAYNSGLASAKIGEDMRNADDKSNYKEKFTQALGFLEPLTVSLTKKDLEPMVWELLVTVYANLGMTEKAQDALKKKESLKN
ncbi:MAG: tetratricopeptide repeat protein [Bacteroidetes bacterium]|nr:tetratricopeptide repeat protein [Bacteroidota bacterium]